MTLEELQKNWKDYALVQTGGNPTVLLRDAFMLCLGPFEGGLLFDTGGAQGAPAYVLRPDENDACWVRTGPGDQDWQLMGKLVRLPDPDGQGDKKKPKKKKTRARSK